jgi:uncharacterized protein YbjT (DUF2867 family)
MTSPILVTGGTGNLGGRVVRRLREAGREVRVLSRRGDAGGDVEHVKGDLSTGDGIDAAVRGTEIVVHCAGSRTGDDVKARSLVRAASSAAVSHLLLISVVGADRVPVESWIDRAMFGYFASKRAAEEVVAGSGLPWSTLRATQFHDLMLMTVRQMAKLPMVPAFSGVRFQPVDTDVVAARLVELALGRPSGSRTRRGRAAGAEDGRPPARVPPRRAQAAADRARPGAGEGGPRGPLRRDPHARARGRPDVGGVPRRPRRRREREDRASVARQAGSFVRKSSSEGFTEIGGRTRSSSASTVLKPEPVM